MELDLTEKHLLNQIQYGVPLAGRPFRDMGVNSSLDEDEVIRRVLYLKESGMLRWVGAVVDWRKLGFKTTLVAMSVPAERLEEAAQYVNRQQGVGHSYARTHRYNLWFFLNVSPSQELDAVIEELAFHVGSKATLNLPALRIFKIGSFYDMLGKGGNGQEAKDAFEPLEAAGQCCARKPSVAELGILKELQNDMPIKRRPFDQMARRVDIYLEEFLEKSQELIRQGVIRRYSGVVHHRKVGLTHNVLSCWKVPPPAVEAAGAKMVRLPAVARCYERATSSAWPYNVFATIDGRSQEECDAVTKQISKEIRVSDCIMLPSIREYVKDAAAWPG